MLKIAVCLLGCGVLFMVLPLFVKMEQPSKEVFKVPLKIAKPCYYVSVQNLHLRQAPHLDSPILAKLPKNTEICKYEGMENDFLKTSKGYVYFEYLSLMPVKEDKQVQKAKIVLRSYPKELDWFKKASRALETKDYKLAKILAYKQNLKDPLDVRSYEIYAKTLYEEGDKEGAKRLLQAVLNYEYNTNLQNLLKSFKEKI